MHYAIDNVGGGGGGVDLTAGGYSEAEKYTTLSTNRPAAGVSGTGADIIDVVSTGPFSLTIGDSVVVAFALLAGDSLIDLQLSAANAQAKYDSLYLPLAVKNINAANAAQFSLFPNPAKEFLTINYTCTEKQKVTIEIKNALGQNVKTVMNEEQSSGKHSINLKTNAFEAGIYFVQFITNDNLITQKIVME